MTPAAVFFGEALVDVVVSRRGTATFHPGGAPANAAVAAARHHGDNPGGVLLVATVGGDPFGRWLRLCLMDEGVDVGQVRVAQSHATSLAIAHEDLSTNDRFWFYRDADLCVSRNQTVLKSWDLGCLAYGSLSVARPDQPLVEALKFLKNIASAERRPILFDVNYRRSLWDSDEHFRHEALKEIATATVVKANRNEASLILGTVDSDTRSLAYNLLDYGPELVVITEGAGGLFASMGRTSFDLRAPIVDAPSSDSIGPGDVITGCMASWLANLTLPLDVTDEVERVLSAAMHSASLVATRAVGAGWPSSKRPILR